MSSEQGEMSPAAAPPEGEDLLSEILLRLPPQPSSLPRASAVCNRWRSLASDPGFSRRFRAYHRRNPPLLGCFVDCFDTIHFRPTLEAPNRVPQGRFSFPIHAGDCCQPLGCRHGLALIFHASRKQLLVWDPVTGDQHRLDIPPGFDMAKNRIGAAVLRAAEDTDHFQFQFQVVLVGNSSDIQKTQAVASVYSSETGVWGDLIETPLPSEDPSATAVYTNKPAVMVGDSLYWLLAGNSERILEFDLARRSLDVIPVPVEETGGCSRQLVAEGGGLGFLLLIGSRAQLWKRKTDCDDVASWVLGRSIELDKLLSLNSEKMERVPPFILGFAEGNNVVLLWTFIGIFSVQFESLRFKKLFESSRWCSYLPFEAVYTADKGIGGGHDGAELLQNT